MNGIGNNEFQEMTKDMTAEEMIDVLDSLDDCPKSYGLTNFCDESLSCYGCARKAIEVVISNTTNDEVNTQHSVRTYKNSEAIAMLEDNPNIKFECNKLYTLFTRDNKIIIEHKLAKIEHCGFCLDDEWTLVQEPVTFMEAVNSNKKIRYEEWSNFVDVKEVLSLLTLPNTKSVLDMMNGKWYIEN